MVHHPSILKGRDDVPRKELEMFMANTTEVLVMIEVTPATEEGTSLLLGCASTTVTYCTALIEEPTAAIGMEINLKIGLYLQERASPSTLLVYHTTALAAKDKADPKQHSNMVRKSPPSLDPNRIR